MWELHELILWLRAVADATPNRPDDFQALEPNLRFKREGTGDNGRIDAYFTWEALPSCYVEVSDRVNPFVITFTPGVAGLRYFADGLEEALHQFPLRIAEEDGPARRFQDWLKTQE